MAQNKNTSTFRKKLNHGLMNAFAIFMTLMPIITIGIWTQQQFFNDFRRVTALESLSKPSSPPRLFEEPLVTVTFDDGWETIYSEAAPILHSHNIRTTQYILSGTFDDPNYFSKEQVLSLQQAGHEIAGHGQDHVNLTTLTDDQLQQELKGSQDMFKQIGVKDNMHFASPYGASDAKTRKAISRYYVSHRNTDADLKEVEITDVNTKSRFDKYNIVSYTVRSDTTTQQISDALELARKHNAWFVLTYHQVDDSKGMYSVTPETFESHMKLLKASQIKVVTIGDVISTLERGGQ